MLTESGVSGGLVVVVGCEDSKLLAGLASQAGYVVQGIDTRSDRIESATAALNARGLCGKASASRFDGRFLPYVDNLVNLLVIPDPAAGIADAEIQRVLAPGGVALIRGRKVVKEIPAEIDSWTHHARSPGYGGCEERHALLRR